MDAHLRELARTQEDLVARWQLAAAGWTHRRLAHHAQANGWRAIHTGVYALTQAPLTQRQRWIAASLTAPATFLSHASAGACWGYRPFDGAFEVVTRHGRGGPRKLGALLVCRSSTLEGDTTAHDGIPIVAAARTLIDLAPNIGAEATKRAFREAIRLKCTTASEVREVVGRHGGRPGTPLLADLSRRYATVPYVRTRSDAEGRGLEVLHDAAQDPPEVNVRVSGEEADLVWRSRRLIIELDGPQFHLFADEDRRKQRLWETAGFVVRRLATDAVYYAPERLVALARE